MENACTSITLASACGRCGTLMSSRSATYACPRAKSEKRGFTSPTEASDASAPSRNMDEAGGPVARRAIVAAADVVEAAAAGAARDGADAAVFAVAVAAGLVGGGGRGSGTGSIENDVPRSETRRDNMGSLTCRLERRDRRALDLRATFLGRRSSGSCVAGGDVCRKGSDDVRHV